MNEKITQKETSLATFQVELSQLEKNNSLLLEKLKMARLDGDLSENADWLLIKEKVELYHRKIAQLKKKITQLKWNNNSQEFIVYRLLATGEDKIVELTNEWETNPTQNKISYLSPLGIALTNKKIGEISEVKTEPGNYQVLIIARK